MLFPSVSLVIGTRASHNEIRVDDVASNNSPNLLLDLGASISYYSSAHK